jgi:hypothetical protein
VAAQVKLLVAGEVGYRWLERSKSWLLERLGIVLVAGEAKLFVAEKGQTPDGWSCWGTGSVAGGWVVVAGETKILLLGQNQILGYHFFV